MGENFALRLRAGAIPLVTQRLGISRSDLQRAMGVAEATLYRVERGDVLASNKTIAALLAVSGMPLEELFELVAEDELPA